MPWKTELGSVSSAIEHFRKLVDGQNNQKVVDADGMIVTINNSQALIVDEIRQVLSRVDSDPALAAVRSHRSDLFGSRCWMMKEFQYTLNVRPWLPQCAQSRRIRFSQMLYSIEQFRIQINCCMSGMTSPRHLIALLELQK